MKKIFEFFYDYSVECVLFSLFVFLGISLFYVVFFSPFDEKECFEYYKENFYILKRCEIYEEKMKGVFD